MRISRTRKGPRGSSATRAISASRPGRTAREGGDDRRPQLVEGGVVVRGAEPVVDPQQDLVAAEADAVRGGVGLDVGGDPVGGLDGGGEALLERPLALPLALVEDAGPSLAEVEGAVGLVADEHDARPVGDVRVVGHVDRGCRRARAAGSSRGTAGRRSSEDDHAGVLGVELGPDADDVGGGRGRHA